MEDINAEIEEKGLNRLSDIDIHTNPAYSKIFLGKCSTQDEIVENYKNVESDINSRSIERERERERERAFWLNNNNCIQKLPP